MLLATDRGRDMYFIEQGFMGERARTMDELKLFRVGIRPNSPI